MVKKYSQPMPQRGRQLINCLLGRGEAESCYLLVYEHEGLKGQAKARLSVSLGPFHYTFHGTMCIILGRMHEAIQANRR